MEELWGKTVSELADKLIAFEDSIQYGEYAQVSLHLQELPTRVEAAEFYENAIDAGFHLNMPKLSYVQGVPTMSFALRKGSPQWAALIPIIPTIAIIGLITFGIIKIKDIGNAIMPVLLTAMGGTILVIALLRQPLGQAATEYARRR